jgi:DnaK suppressor protein
MTAEFHTQFKPYQPKKGEQYMNPKQLEHFPQDAQHAEGRAFEDIDRTVHTMQDEATIFADPNDRAVKSRTWRSSCAIATASAS